jgi:putative ABC transport system permease protein
MLKNYFKIAARNLLTNKFYSLINIAGLAIGIACFLLILLFVEDELKYDRFHTKADRIYRVVEKIDSEEGQGEESSSNPFAVGKTLAADYPHLVEASVRFFNFQLPALTLQYGEKKLNEKRLFFTDSTVFEVFDFPLAQGSRKALSEPNSIVLTEELARKYFGSGNPMGKILKFEGILDLKVTGVLGKIPEQSHIHFDGLISFGTVNRMMGPNYEKNWIWNPCWTYLLLREGASAPELERQMPDFIKKYYPEFIRPQITHYLQPLKDIHLHSRLDYEIEPNGNAGDIYIFSAIGLFILIIACINFMNLATARSAKRSKEVGIRKVLGAYRLQLIGQFLGESILLSFIAILLSLVFIELAMPLFNSISGKTLSTDIFTSPHILVRLVAIGLFTGLISGTYPALFLSAFEPMKVLKGQMGSGKRSAFFRKNLVVLQFSISLVLIISTVIIYNQLKYLKSADLGFKKDQVVIFPTRPPMVNKYDVLKEELLKNRNVTGVTCMNEVIGEKHNTHEFNYEGMQPGKWIYFPALIVDESFVETFNIKILAGRGFSKDIRTDDSLGLLINEAMVKHLGWKNPQEAIGKQFHTPSGKEKVIGVVKNFNFVSLTDPIGPFVLDLPLKRGRAFWTKYVAARISPSGMRNTIAHIEATWNKFAPAYPFEYFFLDDSLNKQYRSQDNLFRLIGYFSVLAIFIACLGLFALASFTAEQRTKEIGIRKVLGASVASIIHLLSREFLMLILISSLIAWPLSLFLMQKWLDTFAYRINIDYSIFLFAAIGVLVIAFLTVLYQAMKAALSNPATSIKYE